MMIGEREYVDELANKSLDITFCLCNHILCVSLGGGGRARLCGRRLH